MNLIALLVLAYVVGLGAALGVLTAMSLFS